MFEPLLTKEDAIVSDSLNHASIIDGVRLCKAARYRYVNNDMAELEARLKEARANGARNIIVVTDGVFSMDGYVAPTDKICDLADAHEAMVKVDERTPRDSSARLTRPTELERARPRGHHHRHVGQGDGWGHGWVHDRKARDH